MNDNYIKIIKNEFEFYQAIIEKLNNNFLAVDIEDKNNNRKNKSIIYLNINTNIENIELMLSDTNVLLLLDKFDVLIKLKNILQIPIICMTREFFWHKYKLGLFKDAIITKNYYQKNKDIKDDKISFIENIFKCIEFHLKNKNNQNNFDYQQLENSINYNKLGNYFRDFIYKRKNKKIIQSFLNFKEIPNLKMIELSEYLKLEEENQKELLVKYSIKVFKLMLQDIQNYQDFNYVDIVPNSKWEDISKLNKEYFKIPFKNLSIFNFKINNQENNINQGVKPNFSDIDIILINYLLNIYLSKDIYINNINDINNIKNKSILGTNDENITIAFKQNNINYAQELIALELAVNKELIPETEIFKFIKNLEKLKIKENIIKDKLNKNKINEIIEEEIVKEVEIKFKNDFSKGIIKEKINTNKNLIKIKELINFISDFKNIQNLLKNINKNKDINVLKENIKESNQEQKNKIDNVIKFINLCREKFELKFHGVRFVNINNSFIYPYINNDKKGIIIDKIDTTVHDLVGNLYLSSEIIKGNNNLKELKKYIYKINKDKFYFKISENYLKRLQTILPPKLSSIFEIESQKDKTLKISIKRKEPSP